MTIDETISTSVPIGIAPSGSLQGQGKNILSGSPVEMMPSTTVQEQSPITGLVRARIPAAKVLPTPISSSLLRNKLDYSRDDIDWDNVRPALDTSKFSYLIEEEVQVASPEKELPLGGTATTEGILSIQLITFLVNHIDVVLTPSWITFAEVVATTKGDTSSNIAEMTEELT